MPELVYVIMVTEMVPVPGIEAVELLPSGKGALILDVDDAAGELMENEVSNGVHVEELGKPIDESDDGVLVTLDVPGGLKMNVVDELVFAIETVVFQKPEVVPLADVLAFHPTCEEYDELVTAVPVIIDGNKDDPLNIHVVELCVLTFQLDVEEAEPEVVFQRPVGVEDVVSLLQPVTMEAVMVAAVGHGVVMASRPVVEQEMYSSV